MSNELNKNSIAKVKKDFFGVRENLSYLKIHLCKLIKRGFLKLDQDYNLNQASRGSGVDRIVLWF